MFLHGYKFECAGSAVLGLVAAMLLLATASAEEHAASAASAASADPHAEPCYRPVDWAAELESAPECGSGWTPSSWMAALPYDQAPSYADDDPRVARVVAELASLPALVTVEEVVILIFCFLHVVVDSRAPILQKRGFSSL